MIILACDPSRDDAETLRNFIYKTNDYTTCSTNMKLTFTLAMYLLLALLMLTTYITCTVYNTYITIQDSRQCCSWPTCNATVLEEER